MKQARAYGLSVVLATQNLVNLGYKGLSNAGTWFLGRLQTERDKARVLNGLEGASDTTGAAFDHKQMEFLLSGLDSRVFLMNNVHDDEPIVFHTRWALPYLSGPLSPTRQKKSYTSWKSALKNHLCQKNSLVLYKSAKPKAVSSPEETEGEFHARLVQMQHELHDVAIEKLKQKYNSKLVRIQEQIVTAGQRFEKEKSQVSEKSYSIMLSTGQTLLGGDVWSQVSQQYQCHTCGYIDVVGRLNRQGKNGC